MIKKLLKFVAITAIALATLATLLVGSLIGVGYIANYSYKENLNRKPLLKTLEKWRQQNPREEWIPSSLILQFIPVGTPEDKASQLLLNNDFKLSENEGTRLIFKNRLQVGGPYGEVSDYTILIYLNHAKVSSVKGHLYNYVL